MTASKVRAAMAAATHQTQVLPTIDFMLLTFSSSVAAATHQIQVFPATDFELMITPSIYCVAKFKHASNRYTLASIM